MRCWKKSTSKRCINENVIGVFFLLYMCFIYGCAIFVEYAGFAFLNEMFDDSIFAVMCVCCSIIRFRLAQVPLDQFERGQAKVWDQQCSWVLDTWPSWLPDIEKNFHKNKKKECYSQLFWIQYEKMFRSNNQEFSIKVWNSNFSALVKQILWSRDPTTILHEFICAHFSLEKMRKNEKEIFPFLATFLKKVSSKIVYFSFIHYDSIVKYILILVIILFNCIVFWYFAHWTRKQRNGQLQWRKHDGR